jgi:hypothetical protein
MQFESSHIKILVVWRALAPTLIDDPNPFIGQGSNRFVKFFDGLLILRQRQSLLLCGGRPKASNLIYQNCKICLTL